MQHHNQPLDPDQVVRSLLAAPRLSESPQTIKEFEIVEIIKALQNNPGENVDDLIRVEWAYLPLLQERRNAAPKLLEGRLATEPQFFCELIRRVFRSKKKERPTQPETEEAKNIASNAYLLLSEWKTPPVAARTAVLTAMH